MRYNWSHIVLLGMCFMLPGCSKHKQSIDPAEYRREIEQWRQGRLTRLTSETGWLTLCGLFWLREGPNRCGSDSSNDIVFPMGKAPAVLGTIWCTGKSTRFEVRSGVDVRCADSTVTSVVLKSDEDSTGPTILTCRTLSFYVIQRGDKLGVRVKDKENPARVNFKGLDYFPIDVKWRIDARFDRYNPPHVLQIPDVVGSTQRFTCPGALVFEHDGRTYSIDAVLESDTDTRLFIMFSDQTSGGETYGGGRQLYTDLPDSSDNVALDFNKAYNWPCVFTEYATCPIPPPQNRLPFRIDAGEKMYIGHSQGVLHLIGSRTP